MAKNIGDQYVYNVQVYLNQTYGNDNRYNKISEDGYIGWKTIYAMTRALQIELGIEKTADSFGPTTISKFNTMFPNGIIQQDDNDTSENNIYAIIQCALLCKGYGTGLSQPTKHFYNGTGNAVKKLKTDAGCVDTSSTVTLNIMKALLSMDYFYSYSTSNRVQNIVLMQRYLNNNYENYIGLTPCDGVYNRSTNKALIYAIQAEEGMPTSVANGNFGPSTKRCCPSIPYNNVEKDYNGKTYSESKINRFIKLLNIALYANGIGDGNITETFSVALIKQFQVKYALSVTGECDLSTWLSTLVSSGDTSRNAIACDCATILTKEKAQTLYNKGYRYVGRYLSGTIGGTISKALTNDEINIAFNAGLNIFPIQQSSANTISYFTIAQAEIDANSAYEHAFALKIPAETTIYFAVDCDPTDVQITNYILPYFQKIKEIMEFDNYDRYKIGIYGTRNVCQRVSDAGCVSFSFVSDMSTGFSGNLGFPIPNNWAFDQFSTITVGSGTGSIEIDKDGFSGRDTGFDHLDISDPPSDPNYNNPIGYDTISPQPIVCVNKSTKSYNVYSFKKEGIDDEPANTEFNNAMDDLGFLMFEPYICNKWGVEGRKVGEIKPGDLFVRFYCRNNEYGNLYPEQMLNEGDGVHKVLFRTSDGIVRYGYIQEVIATEDYNVNDSQRLGKEPFYFYNFDSEKNALVAGIGGSTNPSLNVFEVKRELHYISSPSGISLGKLVPGTKLKGAGSAGATNHEYMYFEKKQIPGSSEWIYLDDENNKGAFVNLDMKNGVNGYDRALW